MLNLELAATVVAFSGGLRASVVTTTVVAVGRPDHRLGPARPSAIDERSRDAWVRSHRWSASSKGLPWIAAVSTPRRSGTCSPSGSSVWAWLLGSSTRMNR